MSYSRVNASPRYRELLEQYRQLHVDGERRLGIPAEKTFNGQSLMPHALRIKELIDSTDARTVLDYGSGKGQQYSPMVLKTADGTAYDGVVDFWAVDSVHCYDPGYAPHSVLPEGRFDAVICTDVLEHCPEEDMPWIVGELFHYAQKFVYANVACYPAAKHLPSGENAHCTIRPVQWWKELFTSSASTRPGIVWEVWVEYHEQTPAGTVLRKQRLGS